MLCLLADKFPFLLDDMRQFKTVRRVTKSTFFINLALYFSFVFLAASFSSVADAVFATAAPTVIPQGNTGGRRGEVKTPSFLHDYLRIWVFECTQP